MTDPIRIPVLPREDNYGDCSYDYVRIDTDLARRIVAQGAAAMPLQMDKDGMVRPIAGGPYTLPSQSYLEDRIAKLECLLAKHQHTMQTEHGERYTGYPRMFGAEIDGNHYDKLDQEWRDPNGPAVKPVMRGYETIGDILAERDKAMADLAALRQAHWDGRSVGGFDNDGDDTPKAVVSDFADMIRRDWAEMRSDLDEARGELDKALADLAACRAELAQWKEALSGAQDNAAQWKRHADESAAQRDRLAGLLMECKELLDYYDPRVSECGIAHRIDAALAELEKNK